jgi:AP-3 complex subunit beta
MSSIRVPDLIQIQILAIRKCSTDRSPYVRKCACIALTKAYSLDHSQLSELEEILSTLLDDSSTMVLGSAVAAFNEMCPLNFRLIHPCYRKLCHLLPDMDEWTQAPLLGLMTRYVRTFFTDPVSGGRSTCVTVSSSAGSDVVSGKGSQGSSVRVTKRRVVQQAFYSDDEEDRSEDDTVVLEQENPYSPDKHMQTEMGSVFTGRDADAELGANLDVDHSLLLKTSLSLLKSRNACVVLAVCTLHHYCGPRTSTSNAQIGKALIRILKNSRETQFVVLSSIKSFAQENPFMFAPYLTDFFVKLSDPLFNRWVL